MTKIKVRYQSISEILIIKEYWNLNGREPFLSLTWELDFSQARSFRRMLKNHKNFDFTQIADKTDVIFLKSPKTMFARWEFFSKNQTVTHNYIWVPNIMLSFRKKLESQSQENLRTDGTSNNHQPLFSEWLVGIHQILF